MTVSPGTEVLPKVAATGLVNVSGVSPKRGKLCPSGRVVMVPLVTILTIVLPAADRGTTLRQEAMLFLLAEFWTKRQRTSFPLFVEPSSQRTEASISWGSWSANFAATFFFSPASFVLIIDRFLCLLHRLGVSHRSCQPSGRMREAGSRNRESYRVTCSRMCLFVKRCIRSTVNVRSPDD